MCHYITAVLPASTDIAALRGVAEAHCRSLRALDNPSIQKQLKEGEGYFLTTSGHCDCGTPLGANAAHAADDTQAQVRRLRAKGWGETKVTRWLGQRGEHQAQKTASERLRAETEIARWRAFLAETLSRNDTPYVCLLLHRYDGPLDRHTGSVSREAVALGEADSDFLDAMREDVLYEFRA